MNILNEMPARSRSRGRKRGRGRSRSSSMGSGMYAAAMRSRSASRTRSKRSRITAQGTHVFSRRAAPIDEEMNGLFLARNYSYTFDMLQQSTEFTELFDNYRIDRIELTIQMINNPNATFTLNTAGGGTSSLSYANSTNFYPKLWWCIDRDGGATETLSTMRERQGVRCRILQPNKSLKISFKPAVRTLTYTTATTQGFAPKSIKLDMADANVPHYGVHMVFDSNGLDPTDAYPFKFRIERKYIFTCTGVR